MGDVQVIRATRDHVPAIRAMVQDAYAKYVDRIGKPPAPMLEDYEKILEEGTQEVWVLVQRSTRDASSPTPNSDGEKTVQQQQQQVDLEEEEDKEKSTNMAAPEAVGSIILAPDSVGAALKINNLVVDPGFQGKGYGRVLMGFAEELARARGLHKLTLFTNVMMWENIGLYAKLGFSETGRKVEDGYERVYFEKGLGL
ncbi:acetyltransferase [Apiospora phragmitis]|uniref:Acetyltransferase n=1 Tax=Apiospora phragmitis TaxID=2905665 RepID=A0ABR1VYG5_9PEZI